MSRDRNPTRFNKTFGVNNFYFRGPDWPYPMGHFSMMGNVDANILRLGAPRIVPGMTLEIMADHTLPFWMTTEDLPDPNNRVTLTENGGIMLSYTPNNEEAHRQLQRMLKSMLKDIGCHDHLVPLQAYIPGRIPLAGVAHQNGTARFGRDPSTSVLDLHCKAAFRLPIHRRGWKPLLRGRSLDPRGWHPPAGSVVGPSLLATP